jgi:hypothetical protein
MVVQAAVRGRGLLGAALTVVLVGIAATVARVGPPPPTLAAAAAGAAAVCAVVMGPRDAGWRRVAALTLLLLSGATLGALFDPRATRGTGAARLQATLVLAGVYLVAHVLLGLRARRAQDRPASFGRAPT